MVFEFSLSKMQSVLSKPVQYFFTFPSGEQVVVNDFIGKKIEIEHNGDKFCRKCGVKVQKFYGEGFCYKCFVTAPEADDCIIHPQKCKAHLGISRDKKWSEENCLIDHYVYLALTSGLKVGVTRFSQVPTRWIDQGAVKAIKLAKTPYRQLAGEIEVHLKSFFADKTNWQKMLKNDFPDIDLIEEKRNAASLLRSDLLQYLCMDNEITYIEYPVIHYPAAVKSLNLDKQPVYSGKLMGIKGQYLIFEDGKVFNVRRHTGFFIKFKVV